jgi:hypothetical protein
MASLLKSVTSLGADAIRDAAIKRIPELIAKNEPLIEKSLSENLAGLKAQHPEEAQLFLANWRKLNKVVESKLGTAAGKRTKRNKRKYRKH